MSELEKKTIKELKEIAKSIGLNGYSTLNKQELISKIKEKQSNINTKTNNIEKQKHQKQNKLKEDKEKQEEKNIKNKDAENKEDEDDDVEVYLISKENAQKIIREHELEKEKKELNKEKEVFNFKKVLENVNAKNEKKKSEELKKLKEERKDFIRVDDFNKVTENKLEDIKAEEERKEQEKIEKQKQMKEVVLDNGKVIRMNPATDNILEGYIDVLRQGYGFIRSDTSLTPTDDDAYISAGLIDQFSMKTGSKIVALTRENKDNNYPGVIYVIDIEKRNNNKPYYSITTPEDERIDAEFGKLTPLYPYKRIILEHNAKEISSRMIDMVSPIGLGQRALIVSPPKAGKTTLLKRIARSIKANDFDNKIYLMMLLIDERPEEVTDIERTIDGKVYSSTFDMSPDDHVNMAEKTIKDAKELVLEGKDVVILLDSITRLARAYNIIEPSSGKILSGGFDPVALYKPKKFFGAARQTEEAGSLTIIATALVDTGSKMDDFIFEEFKGTGNMEIVLDRDLSESRIFPAINLKRSGTRKEELLLSDEELKFMEYIRSSFAHKDDFTSSKDFISLLKNYETNEQMITELLGELNKFKSKKEKN